MNMRRGGGSKNRTAAAAAAAAVEPTTNATNATPATSTTVEDRHKEVMAKLRASRKDESRKSINNGNSVGVVGRLNPFKRK